MTKGKKAKAEHIKSQEGRREKLRELLPMGNYSLSTYKKDTLSLPKHKLMKPIKLKKKD